MFKKINISELDIPRNQIIKTKIYKYRVGIMIFIIYMSNKKQQYWRRLYKKEIIICKWTLKCRWSRKIFSRYIKTY